MKRADCQPGGAYHVRPCPFMSCRYHLVEPRRGGGKPPAQPPQGSATCALDVADEGEHQLVDIGRLLGMSRERARQIQEKGLARAKRAAMRLGVDLADLIPRGLHPLAALASSSGEGFDSRGRDRARIRGYNRAYVARRRAPGGRQ